MFFEFDQEKFQREVVVIHKSLNLFRELVNSILSTQEPQICLEILAAMKHLCQDTAGKLVGNDPRLAGFWATVQRMAPSMERLDNELRGLPREEAAEKLYGMYPDRDVVDKVMEVADNLNVSFGEGDENEA